MGQATAVNDTTYLSLIVHGFKDGEKIQMDKGEVLNVEFIYKINESNSIGKPVQDTMMLVITVDLELAQIYDSKEIKRNNVELLERWHNTKYNESGEEDKYYRQIGVVCNFNSYMENKIVLNNGYLLEYIEECGDKHIATITVKQKEDVKTHAQLNEVKGTNEITSLNVMEADSSVEQTDVLNMRYMV